MAPPAAKRVGGSVQGAGRGLPSSRMCRQSSLVVRPMPGGSVRELSKTTSVERGGKTVVSSSDGYQRDGAGYWYARLAKSLA